MFITYTSSSRMRTHNIQASHATFGGFFFLKFGAESPPKVAVNQITVKVQAPSDKVDSGFPSASPHNSTSPLAPTRRQVVGCLEHVISTGESRKGGNPRGYLNIFFSRFKPSC